ncbi:unnamed protein product, partial [Laminaria digitata]
DNQPEPETAQSRRKEEYEAQLTAELLQYRGMKPLREDANPLQWWEEHRSTLPLLKELAARVLCVPASSASSERLFSKAGLTLTKQRARLTGSRVAQLVTVRGAIASGVLDNYQV